MEAWFFEKNGSLMFHLERKAYGRDDKALPFVFEGLATERHKKEYASKLEEFLNSKKTLLSVEAEMTEASKGKKPIKLKKLINKIF